MPLQNPFSGNSNVAEYSVSGVPFVTSSTYPNSPTLAAISFPQVTRFITVKNLSGNQRAYFGFSPTGITTTNNRFILDGGESITMEIRTKQLFLSGGGGQTYTLLAGLTTINTGSFPVFTSSFPLYMEGV